jgi:hypothetical protein
MFHYKKGGRKLQAAGNKDAKKTSKNVKEALTREHRFDIM